MRIINAIRTVPARIRNKHNYFNINVPELRALARFIEQLPDEHFNIGDWGYGNHDIKNHCGTVACVAGWEAVRVARKHGITQLFHEQSDDPFTTTYPNMEKLSQIVLGKDGYTPQCAGEIAAKELRLKKAQAFVIFFVCADGRTDGARALMYGAHCSAYVKRADVVAALRRVADNPDKTLMHALGFKAHDEYVKYVQSMEERNW